MSDDRIHYPSEQSGCYRRDPLECCPVCMARLAVAPIRLLARRSWLGRTAADRPGVAKAAVFVAMLTLGLLTTAVLGGVAGI